MSGKPRSAALLQLNQNKRNAAKTLKERGKKANMASMMALVRHRREGKSNDEYFSALNSSTANTVALVTGASAPTVANTTVKKERTPAQAAANQRRRNATAALKAMGLKANSASVKQYLNSRKGAAVAPSPAANMNNISLEEAEELVLESPAAILPTVEEAKVLKKATMSHSEAGKKAATSEKGAAWLDQVTAAKRNLNASFVEVGLNKKATRANAMRLASTRRNNPGKARNVELNILTNAQGKMFNKANKTARKTAKKSANKRNNNLNRATRNFVNRLTRNRNRLTRKPVRNYGTMKQTKRNRNNSYRPYKGNNNNNFNIETLRNTPFNSAQ